MNRHARAIQAYAVAAALLLAGCGTATPTPAPPTGSGAPASAAPGQTLPPGVTPTPTPAPGATSAAPGEPASTSAGQVPGPFWGARSVRLSDSRVFVYGGAQDINSPAVNASPAGALFDPAAGTWKATAPGPNGRFEPGVFPGANGTAIVMGFAGITSGVPPLAPLLYDPAKDAWRSGATFTQSSMRSSIAMAQLRDGRILVVSGAGAELYDAGTDAWTRIDPAPNPVDAMQAVTLADGRVLVVSGEADSTRPSSIARLFDPVAGTWRLAAPMPVAWRLPDAVALPDGGALVLGGPGHGFGVTTLVRYDATTDTWGQPQPLLVPRQEPVITALADGRVLVIGGSVSTARCATVTGGEVYDPAAGTLTAVTGLATARDASIATLLADGRVLVALGAAAASRALNRGVCELNRFLTDSEVLDPAKLALVSLPADTAPTAAAPGLGAFTAADAPVALGAASVTLTDGSALLMGGFAVDPAVGGGYPMATRIARHVGLDGSIGEAAPMASARSAPEAVRLADGSVLAVGQDASPFAAGKPRGPMAERYDPVANRWHAVADPGAHVGAALVALPGGGAMLIGGTPSAAGAPFAIDAGTLLFDAAAETWSPGPPLPAGVLDPAVVALPDGRVLVAGGLGLAGPVSSAYVFDPASSAWSALPNLPAPRARALAVVLAGGRVLLVGGYGPDRLLGDAVLLDPGTGVWTSAGSPGAAREGAALGVLPDGRVLLAGGLAADGTGKPLADTAVFDPMAGTWTLGPSMTAARAFALLVTTGQTVQVLGGQGVNGATKPPATRELLGGG